MTSPSRRRIDAENDADKLDPIARALLDLLAGRPAGATASPLDVARAVAEARRTRRDPPDLWRRYLPAVRQQMLFLARRGRIEILRKGKPVDPEDFKGVVRVRLTRPDRTDDTTRTE